MADPLRPWRRPPPPPPDLSVLPPDLVARAKGLRLRLGDPAGGGSEARRRMRNDYDQALVVLGDLLELPGAPDPDLVIGRRVLTTLERSLLEKALVGRGVDLGIAEPRHLRALNAGPQRGSTASAWSTDSGPADSWDEPTQAWDISWPEPPGHEPPPPLPPPVLTSRERLVVEAKTMRRRLDLYEADDRLWPTKVQEWCEDLDSYDGVIIDLAVVVGLPQVALPDGNRRRLLSEERSSIEHGLARAGLDLGEIRPR